MTKDKLIIGNWKLNPSKLSQARVLMSREEHGMMFTNRKKVEVVVCPPPVFLTALKSSAHFIKLGSQTVSHEVSGAFTGEVSVKHLKEVGVDYCLVGHSERRTLGVTDKQVNQKIKLLLQENITPVLCVGFGTKKSHGIGTIKRMVLNQLKSGLSGLGSKTRQVVVAYEPVWAISEGLGTGQPTSPEHAAEMEEYIKEKYRVKKVIYGGSTDGKNASSFAKAGLDGVLPGGASLDAEEFIEIIKAFSN